MLGSCCFISRCLSAPRRKLLQQDRDVAAALRVSCWGHRAHAATPLCPPLGGFLHPPPGTVPVRPRGAGRCWRLWLALGPCWKWHRSHKHVCAEGGDTAVCVPPPPVPARPRTGNAAGTRPRRCHRVPRRASPGNPRLASASPIGPSKRGGIGGPKITPPPQRWGPLGAGHPPPLCHAVTCKLSHQHIVPPCFVPIPQRFATLLRTLPIRSPPRIGGGQPPLGAHWGVCSDFRSSVEVLPEELGLLGPYGTWDLGRSADGEVGGGPHVSPKPPPRLTATLSRRLQEQQRQLRGRSDAGS